MKKLITILLLTVNCTLLTALAQPPAIKYQAVARNAEGEPVAEQQISIKLSLHSTSPTGTVAYSELHQPTTNQYGLVNLEIGRGEVQTGVFAEIDWLATDYFLQTEIDITGGENFIDVGTTQLVSVPYSLSAGTAKTAQHSQTATLAETASVAKGVILKDADGTPFKLTIGENGQLTTECAIKAIDADGNEYKTVKIGNQIWMAENLNVGRMILSSTVANPTLGTEQTNNQIIEKYCYENKPENCEKFGGMYQWNEAMNYTMLEGTQGICPDGWRLPTNDEIDILIGSNPSTEEVFNSLMEGGDSGFNIKYPFKHPLPSGYINVGYFWTSTFHTLNNSMSIWYLNVSMGNQFLTRGGFSGENRTPLFVRCIKE